MGRGEKRRICRKLEPFSIWRAQILWAEGTLMASSSSSPSDISTCKSHYKVEASTDKYEEDTHTFSQKQGIQ